MPKLERPSLTRGLKLLKEHVFDNALSLVAGWMSDVTKMVEIDQRDPTKATTYLSWVLPVYDYSHSDGANATGPASLPFPLPPLQEFFDTSWKTLPSTPKLTLTSIQFGFDQKGEAAVVTSHAHGSGAGKVDYDRLAECTFEVIIDEKRPNIIESVAGDWSYLPSRQVAKIEVDGGAFMDSLNRPNPLLVKVSKQLHPYRTYLIRVKVQGLDDNAGSKWDLPGFQVTLGIEHPNVERDKGANIQNLPDDSSARAVPSVSLNVPSGNDKIVADGSAGVVGNIDVIERHFGQRLTGGFYRDGGVPVVEHILEDAGYEIIVVPMFTNMSNNREVRANDASVLPGVGANPGTGKAHDRNWVYLMHPLVVHHVVAVISYATNFTFTGGVHPTAVSFVNEIDVCIGTRGDFVTYESIATQTWTPATKASKLIDRILEYEGTTRSPGEDWTHELMHVPLVGAGGKGFYAQGHPVYCGKASSRYAARQDLNGGAPGTKGLEQFLECRWIMYDTNAGLTGHAGGGSAGSNNVQLVGHDGHCLLLFCKKAMMGGVHDVRV